jgi:hypothetical protein
MPKVKKNFLLFLFYWCAQVVFFAFWLLIGLIWLLYTQGWPAPDDEMVWLLLTIVVNSILQTISPQGSTVNCHMPSGSIRGSFVSLMVNRQVIQVSRRVPSGQNKEDAQGAINADGWNHFEHVAGALPQQAGRAHEETLKLFNFQKKKCTNQTAFPMFTYFMWGSWILMLVFCFDDNL